MLRRRFSSTLPTSTGCRSRVSPRTGAAASKQLSGCHLCYNTTSGSIIINRNTCWACACTHTSNNILTTYQLSGAGVTRSLPVTQHHLKNPKGPLGGPKLADWIWKSLKWTTKNKKGGGKYWKYCPLIAVPVDRLERRPLAPINFLEFCRCGL